MKRTLGAAAMMCVLASFESTRGIGPTELPTPLLVAWLGCLAVLFVIDWRDK